MLKRIFANQPRPRLILSAPVFSASSLTTRVSSSVARTRFASSSPRSDPNTTDSRSVHGPMQHAKPLPTAGFVRPPGPYDQLHKQAEADVTLIEHYGIPAFIHGGKVKHVYRNAPVGLLYALAVEHETADTAISSTGALCARSGARTGRSPVDKRIVDFPGLEGIFWESDACIQLSEASWAVNRERVSDWLSMNSRLYVVDAFLGWGDSNEMPNSIQKKVRIVCARAYHALFMWNMLIRPTPEQLRDFGEPDVVVFNGGEFPANRYTTGMTSKVSVDLNLKELELVVLGSQYAGEMKKGLFSVMHYLMPQLGHLSMHASCNVDPATGGNAAIFFGLSGTGKTTLSADVRRGLIGDDEHIWTDKGVNNIEGGCYAKVIDLDPKEEPLIYNAIKFGTVLENVVLDEQAVVKFSDTTLTANTRASYPVEFIPNSRIPCRCGHPENVIFLTCDAFGLMPPVSLLSPAQASFYFVNGYTAKVAGTEMGVKDPVATFSACFGEAFICFHPSVYATLLAEKMEKHGTKCWLVNTGWSGGPFGVGKRMKLPWTRAIIDSIHDGSLSKAEFVQNDDVFRFQVPTECNGVPSEALIPRNTWQDKGAHDQKLLKLAKMFHKNFDKYRAGSSQAICDAAPVIPADLG